MAEWLWLGLVLVKWLGYWLQLLAWLGLSGFAWLWLVAWLQLGCFGLAIGLAAAKWLRLGLALASAVGYG